MGKIPPIASPRSLRLIPTKTALILGRMRGKVARLPHRAEHVKREQLCRRVLIQKGIELIVLQEIKPRRMRKVDKGLADGRRGHHGGGGERP